MARLLVADDDATPWVEIVALDDSYRGLCACGAHLRHHRITDLIDIADHHVNTNHNKS
jgi:hypothetical protein